MDTSSWMQEAPPCYSRHRGTSHARPYATIASQDRGSCSYVRRHSHHDINARAHAARAIASRPKGLHPAQAVLHIPRSCARRTRHTRPPRSRRSTEKRNGAFCESAPHSVQQTYQHVLLFVGLWGESSIVALSFRD